MEQIGELGNSCKVSELINELKKLHPNDIVTVGASGGMGVLSIDNTLKESRIIYLMEE